MELNQIEQRIIGVLLEKEITTPDQYPSILKFSYNGLQSKIESRACLRVKRSRSLRCH